MHIKLHANAATTPRIRKYIQQSTKTVAELARELGIGETTVRRWKRRTDAQDRSCCPHRLQTTLSPTQEAIVIELRTTLLLSLDDLLVVVRRFINAACSRAGLDRCLRRNGVSNLRQLIPQEPKQPAKSFKDYKPGYVHVDIKYLPQMPDESRRRYLYAAIDRATRWVYIEILPDKDAATAKGFLQRLIRACPIRIVKVLTDNGKEFTDRFSARGEGTPTGNHPFDRACKDHGIEHRLIKPYTPRTKGMVERFNGRIADIIKTSRFASSTELEKGLLTYADTYVRMIPQKALGHKTPLEALHHWHEKAPECFRARPPNFPRPDI